MLGNLRTSSEIFGKVQKMFGNIRTTFGQHFANLRKSSENGRQSSGNRQKHRFEHSKINFISPRNHVISSIFLPTDCHDKHTKCGQLQYTESGYCESMDIVIEIWTRYLALPCGFRETGSKRNLPSFKRFLCLVTAFWSQTLGFQVPTQ